MHLCRLLMLGGRYIQENTPGKPALNRTGLCAVCAKPPSSVSGVRLIMLRKDIHPTVRRVQQTVLCVCPCSSVMIAPVHPMGEYIFGGAALRRCNQTVQ